MTPARRDGALIVAAAAAAWGLDGLLRKPLATQLDAATVVVWEHLIAVLVLAPTLPAAWRAFRRCRAVDRLCIVTIGIGASALATALFTQAFADAGKTGDFITPLVLQKLQPVFAVLLAVILLGERVRRRYLLYAGPALFGAWLLTFPDPWHVRVHRAEVALLALAAAALWAAGTVLGRRVSAAVTSAELTTLRYVWGLVGALGVLRCEHAPMRPGAGNILGLVLLALIPGVAALRVYYAGLRRTLASRATLAELAFPGTAAVVGVLFLGSTLRASQWFGFAIVVVAITAMSAHRAGRPAADPGRALGSDVADRAGLRS